MSKTSKLKIIPLGGLEAIGMNITAFEYEDSIVVVDCGLAFPEDDMYGIYLVIPDITYLLENPENANRGVVIAYDSRRFSAEFAKDTALVLCAEGVPAFLFDALRPVPVLSYAVRHLNAAAGVVITASHNPPE